MSLTIEAVKSVIYDNFWIFHIFFIVLLTLILHSLSQRVLNKIIQKAKVTKTFWDEAFFMALKSPLVVLIWLIGLCMALKLITTLENTAFYVMIPSIRKFGFLIISTWFAVRFIRNVEYLYITSCEQEKKEVDKTLIHAGGQLLTISVVITSILAGMQVFGVPISGLLAFGGIGGAGIAFASKDLLANFFGGLIVYLDRPFKVGDWIRSPDRNIEGVVEYIGWRVTRIRTFDKRPLYVPNGVFLTISVENPSRMHNRRIRTLVGIRYQDAPKMAAIVSDIEAMLKGHPEICQKQTTFVNFVEFASSSLNFLIYTFTKTTNWVKFQGIQQDVFLKVIEIVASHGAECAFPTQTIHIDSPSKIGFSNEHSTKN
jgi:MscS family membrane protein